MQISEKVLVEGFREFVVQQHLVVESESHFGGDTKALADVELCLVRDRWPLGSPANLLVEVKSHHSEDSPNTINKIFGQLLKETGKANDGPRRANSALAILFPAEGADWVARGRSFTRKPGNEYYRKGFLRIKRNIYLEFGSLVGARYVLSFSVDKSFLEVHSWAGFYDGMSPVARF